MRHQLLHLLVAVAVTVAAAIAPTAAAQSDRTEISGLVDELGALLEKGERERLADPWFLRDLRDVLRRYDDPWRKRILDDGFDTRGPGPGRPWRVTQGEFLIDWKLGLRSVVGSGPAPAAAPANQAGSDEQPDLAGALIGALLQQALGGGKDGDSAAPAGSADGGGAWSDPDAPAGQGAVSAAELVAPVAIANAFAVAVELSERRTDSPRRRMEFGVFQAPNRGVGYRIVYQPDDSPPLALVSGNPRGGLATIDLSREKLDLADGGQHILRLTRDTSGLMRVEVDGRQVMEVVDRGFRDPFDGFIVANHGGDLALRRVTIDAAR